MRLTLNISPCPNDTFMFDALINGHIDTRGFSFEVHYADIEELNRRAVQGGTDISKVSYAILPDIYGRYALLDSGSALGHGNGPLLVARPDVDIYRPGTRVVVPGFHTTANLLLRRLYPGLSDQYSLLFSQIARSVASGNFDAGVLIHEGRFTYKDYGLVQVADLGMEWGAATAAGWQEPFFSSESMRETSSVIPKEPASPHGLPLPLGAIVASRTLPEDVRTQVEELLRESIRYAFANPEASRDYIKSHAQEMVDDVIESHIRLFVNDYSLSLGETGRRAVKELTGVEIE